MQHMLSAPSSKSEAPISAIIAGILLFTLVFLCLAVWMTASHSTPHWLQKLCCLRSSGGIDRRESSVVTKSASIRDLRLYVESLPCLSPSLVASWMPDIEASDLGPSQVKGEAGPSAHHQLLDSSSDEEGSTPPSRRQHHQMTEVRATSVFASPLSLASVVKLEATVEAAEGADGPLLSPFTQQACVLYSASVARNSEQQGKTPAAFAAACLAKFSLRLCSSSSNNSCNLMVTVLGVDACLFNMIIGRMVSRQVKANAPQHWQDFMCSHNCDCDKAEVLEFDEQVLLLGAHVVAVGELFQEKNGKLSLRPSRALQQDDWSPEREVEPSSSESKVFITTDPSVLSKRPQG